MTRVYTASKLHHAPLWLELPALWPEVTFTARWPNLVGRVLDTPDNARLFWLHDIADVQRSDCVMIYATPDDHLRGALIEAGAALGLGKRVVLVGENEDFGTWRRHPLVSHAMTFEQARLEISGAWWIS